MTVRIGDGITLDEIAAEFGGTTPHSITEYTRGQYQHGSIPSIRENRNIPFWSDNVATPPEISLNEFSGARKYQKDTYTISALNDTTFAPFDQYDRNQYGESRVLMKSIDVDFLQPRIQIPAVSITVRGDSHKGKSQGMGFPGIEIWHRYDSTSTRSLLKSTRAIATMGWTGGTYGYPYSTSGARLFFQDYLDGLDGLTNIDTVYPPETGWPNTGYPDYDDHIAKHVFSPSQTKVTGTTSAIDYTITRKGIYDIYFVAYGTRNITGSERYHWWESSSFDITIETT